MFSSTLTDLAIEVQHLSKRYEIYAQPGDRLKQFLLPRVRGLAGRPVKPYFEEFWALHDVSFEVKRGETVGIIGVNGSGKSTLLQMICGTLTPSAGTVQTRGRVAALLELGSGFNPEFTGRENVYLNAAVLGLSAEETDERFDDIASFADIRQFMDQPVKTYSSGMVARLAFAVAVQVDPDVLVVDEALSVGDMAFQEKSFTRMKRIRDAGTSILFVSHAPSAVRNFCDRAIWLERGRVKHIGERLGVCDAYQAEMQKALRAEALQAAAGASAGAAAKPLAQPGAGADALSAALESPPVRTIGISAVSLDKSEYRMGEDMQVSIGLTFKGPPPTYGVGLVVYDSLGRVVTLLNTLRDDLFLTQERPQLSLLIRDNHFAPGDYSVSVSVSDEQGMFAYDKLEACLKFSIAMERSVGGLARVDGFLRCQHEWR